MILAKLPSVLSPNRKDLSSISMERALNQIKELLEWTATVAEEHCVERSFQDRIEASIDDVETMLKCIDR